MKYVKLFLLLPLISLLSCDDGDIVVSNFEFESDDVDFCFSEESNQTVFFNENDNEEVFYIIVNGEYDPTEEDVSEYSVDVDATSSTQALVRSVKFADITADDFFCTAAASNVTILNEVIGVEGTVFITTQENIDPEADDDGDGITNEEEGLVLDADGDVIEEELLDTDEDGIPDFRDEDDDNDRVMTQIEISTGVLAEGETLEEDELPDTDADGIPNYRDNDDDGDGIETRFEYTAGTSGPTDADPANSNNDGVLLYLDGTSSENTLETVNISNSFSTVYRTVIRIENLEADSVTYDQITSIGEFEETDQTAEIVSFDETGAFTGTFDNDQNVPIAEINTDVTTGTAPLTVAFDASASTNSITAEESLTFLWDFDDLGASSTSEIVSHTYTEPGTYNVTLTVISDNDDFDRQEIQIIVTE